MKNRLQNVARPRNGIARAVLAAAAVAALGSACSSVPKQKKLAAERISELRKGLTTKREVLALFGEPEIAASDMSGDARLTYFEAAPAAEPRRPAVAHVVGLLFVDKDVQTEADTLVVTLHDDVVEDYWFSKSRYARGLQARARR